MEENFDELIMRGLEKGPISARCTNCSEVETIFEIDEPIDKAFLANYLCSKCDGSDSLEVE